MRVQLAALHYSNIIKARLPKPRACMCIGHPREGDWGGQQQQQQQQQHIIMLKIYSFWNMCVVLKRTVCFLL